MGNYAVGYSRADDGSQRADCPGWAQFSVEWKPSGYARQSRPPKEEQQPKRERREPQPVRQSNAYNGPENPPQRDLITPPLLIDVKSGKRPIDAQNYAERDERMPEDRNLIQMLQDSGHARLLIHSGQ